MQSIGVVASDPEGNAPAKPVGGVEVHQRLSQSKRDRGGVEDHGTGWTVPCRGKPKLLDVEAGRAFQVTHLESDEVGSEKFGHKQKSVIVSVSLQSLYKAPDMSSNLMPPPMGKRLGYVLKRAQHALRIRMDEALLPLALTTPQYSVLSAVELAPGISNATLARAAFVTAQTMQGIVANLERMGLLQRTEDPEHRRIRRGELTKRGHEVLAHAHQLVTAVESRMLSNLSEKESATLAALLECCAENLSKPRQKESSDAH